MQTQQPEMHHIPIVGTVGTKGTERRYCMRARNAVGTGETRMETPCTSSTPGWCLLTAGRQRCLFWDKDNPVWERIAHDLNYEREESNEDDQHHS